MVLVAQVLPARALARHLQSSALLLQPKACSTSLPSATSHQGCYDEAHEVLTQVHHPAVQQIIRLSPRALLSAAYVTRSQALSLSQSSLGAVANPPSSRAVFNFFINRLTGVDHPDTLLCMCALDNRQSFGASSRCRFIFVVFDVRLLSRRVASLLTPRLHAQHGCCSSSARLHCAGGERPQSVEHSSAYTFATVTTLMCLQALDMMQECLTRQVARLAVASRRSGDSRHSFCFQARTELRRRSPRHLRKPSLLQRVAAMELQLTLNFKALWQSPSRVINKSFHHINVSQTRGQADCRGVVAGRGACVKRAADACCAALPHRARMEREHAQCSRGNATRQG